MLVKATREGLVGKETASGYVIDEHVNFVSLPAPVLHRVVRVTNPANGKTCAATVLDIGPFNTDDVAYVIGGARPLAEQGVSVSGEGTNGAGIDLGGWVWRALGMVDNTDVDWRFLDGED